jgi:hypothetical protein
MGMSPSQIHAWLNQDEPLVMNDAHWVLVQFSMQSRKDKINAAFIKVRTAYFEGMRKVGDPFKGSVEAGVPWSEIPTMKNAEFT